MNFAVIPLGDPGPDFLADIQRIDSSAYVVYSPKIYFVRYDGTSTSLAATLGFSNNDKRFGVVIPAKGYFGYASQDLWGWLQSDE